MTTPETGLTPIYVASHRRSGTHLTLDNLVNNFPTLAGGFQNFDSEGNIPRTKLYKTHALADWGIQHFAFPSRVIYVLRDGRDVMVSLYYYAKSHDPAVKDLTFQEFLHTENPYDTNSYDGPMNRVEYWNFHVNSWLNQQHFESMIVSFDQWKTDTEAIIKDVAAFTGHAPNSVIKSMTRVNTGTILTKLLRRTGISKNTAIQFRRGQSGDWKEHFDQQSLDYFNSISATTYNRFAGMLQLCETV